MIQNLTGFWIEPARSGGAGCEQEYDSIQGPKTSLAPLPRSQSRLGGRTFILSGKGKKKTQNVKNNSIFKNPYFYNKKNALYTIHEEL